ncbi:MAG: hypothetical protein HC908_01460 [Calothrix sp. SM1_7_51]|nr:hypothetical protein [Calothrix sp. SM1_7_51]
MSAALNQDALDVTSANSDFSEYVAHLQLHMTLQARNLLPNFKLTQEDSREELLHQTQADFEKLISRQVI